MNEFYNLADFVILKLETETPQPTWRKDIGWFNQATSRFSTKNSETCKENHIKKKRILN